MNHSAAWWYPYVENAIERVAEGSAVDINVHVCTYPEYEQTRTLNLSELWHLEAECRTKLREVSTPLAD